MEPVPADGERLGHPRRHVCRPQPLELRRPEGGLDRGHRLRAHVVLAEIKDRLRHDPLGELTGGASPEELDRALRVARTIVNALARAGLPAITVRDNEPAAEGVRPRGVARERRRPAAPEPPP